MNCLAQVIIGRKLEHIGKLKASPKLSWKVTSKQSQLMHKAPEMEVAEWNRCPNHLGRPYTSYVCGQSCAGCVG